MRDDDTALALIDVFFTLNKSVVRELTISPGAVPVVVTAVAVVVVVVDEVDCELPISPGTVPVVVTSVDVVVDEVVGELLISLGIMTVVSTAVAVFDVVENISVVIMISVVSLGAFLVHPSGAVVEVSSVPVLETMVAGCTELDLVGIDIKLTIAQVWNDNRNIEFVWGKNEGATRWTLKVSPVLVCVSG